MTKGRAELLVRELEELFKSKSVVLVESYEWENFVPKRVYPGCEVNRISLFHGEQNSTITISVSEISCYTDLDNPVVEGATIAFTVIGAMGRIYRSFTLGEDRWFKDETVRNRWLALKYALL